MLYGYGDDRNPYTETVDFLEDLVFQFITDMTHKAMEVGRQNRVQVSWHISFPFIPYLLLIPLYIMYKPAVKCSVVDLH
jgi:hypothetical protein